MSAGDLIKKRREELGMSQTELARRLDISPSTIHRYENGGIGKLPADYLQKLAVALRTSPTYFLGWDEPDDIRDTDTETVDIPIYGSVPAGIPVEALEDIDGTIPIPADWLRGGKQYIALRVHGDSMYPRYLDGDIVIILLTPEFVGGKDSVVYINGYDATLKTVHTYTPGQITLQPVNPMYPTKHYGAGDEPVTCLGHVIELRRMVK